MILFRIKEYKKVYKFVTQNIFVTNFLQNYMQNIGIDLQKEANIWTSFAHVQVV